MPQLDDRYSKKQDRQPAKNNDQGRVPPTLATEYLSRLRRGGARRKLVAHSPRTILSAAIATKIRAR